MGKGASFLKRGFTSKKDKDTNGSAPTGGNTDIPTITTNGSDLSAGSGLKRSTGLTITTDADDSPSESSPPGPADGGSAKHSRTKSMGASSVHSAIVPGAGSGVATFTVVSASGFPHSSDVYVVIHQVRDGKTKTVGKTKHHKSSSGEVKYDETFKISCTPDSLFKIEVKGNHTFGSDDDLGEASYAVDETNSGQEKEIKIGSGSVVLKSSFTPAENHLSASTDSPKSMRRSFLSRRDARPPTREGTPA
jgi:hypothetical protein